MADFAHTQEQLKTFVAERRLEPDARRHIHVAWVCVAEDLRRVEDAETELVGILSQFMPVLGVITKARADRGFRADVQRLLPQARNVLRIRALSEELDDGHKLDPMGLIDLVRATAELIPEGERRAFAAVQKTDLELKRTKARAVVATATASAAGVALTPIPFADAFLLIPIQLGMLAKITSIYCLDFSEGFLKTLIATTVGSSVTTLAGRAIVSGILKLVPGAGTLAGGAIAAATAGAMTTALGETYISVLDSLFTAHKGAQPSTDDVIRAVAVAFRR